MADQAAERPFFVVFIRYWVPVLLYVVVIVALSAQPGLTPPPQFRLTDKFYHSTEYFGLGILLARAVRGGRRWHSPMLDAAMAVTLGVAIGAADEIFQSYVPGRSSDVFDLLADASGVLLAQMLVLLAARD